MPNKNFRMYFKLFIFLNVLFVFSSCVREDTEECTFDFTLIVNLQDREYNNAGELPSITSRAVAPSFKEYVSQFGFQLDGISSTRNLPYASVPEIPPTDTALSIPISHFYEGQYRVVSWGNYLPGALTDLGYALYADNQADADIFFCMDTVEFSREMPSHTCYLYRLKGKLATYIENLPDSVLAVQVNISSVLGYLDRDFNYGHETIFSKIFYSAFQDLTLLENNVAPTPEGESSLVSYTLYSKNSGEAFYTTPPIEITILRNEVTVLQVSLNNNSNDSEIAVWVNNQWEVIQEMSISENL